MTAVDVRNLTFGFGDKLAVDDLSFSVAEGSIFGLLGPNGAGKTTTIRTLTTLLKPASGSIDVFGLDVVKSAASARRFIGYVPQAISSDSGLTVEENLQLFARLFGLRGKTRKVKVAEAIDSLGLSDVAKRLAKTLSGGQVRRLELAQALVGEPRLLVLDEPTVGLDPIARDQLWKHIERLRTEHKMTVLLTTHYMEEADALCDVVAIMHRGVLRGTGAPALLKSELGEGKTLDDVFRHFAGEAFETEEGDGRSVRSARRSARRLG